MENDPRVQLAREFHDKSLQSKEQAAIHRQARDEVIRQLRADDPQTWTYRKLSEALNCSLELIAHIVKK